MNRLLVGLLLVPLSFALDITGRVVADHSGEPLASARVRIVRVGQKLLAADRDTDRNGKFSAPGLPEGNYRLEVSKSNHADTVVQVAGDAEFIVRLVRLGVIAGRVIDANAQPISGAFVFVRTEEDADTAPLRQAIGGSAITDARGEYRAHGLFPGQYVVAASLATTQGGSRGGAVIHRDTFNISGGDDHGNVDLVMPAGSHSIQGRVTRPKEGGRYAVALAPDDHPNLTVALAYAEEGSFRLEGIPPGSYRLLVSGPVRGFSARDSLLGDSRRYGQARVDVLGQDVTGLSIEVSPGIETTFRLVSEDRLPVGVCPTSAQINLRPLEDRAAQALPGLKASFEGERVEGIAPGRYRISALDLRETCFSKPVVVEISESSRSVRIPVASAGAIEGQVLGGLGRRYVVVVVPSDLSAQPRERRLLAAYPDEQSRFSFDGLAPGKYRIAVQFPTAANARLVPADLSKMSEIDVAGGVATKVELPAPNP